MNSVATNCNFIRYIIRSRHSEICYRECPIWKYSHDVNYVHIQRMKETFEISFEQSDHKENSFRESLNQSMWLK